MIIRGISKSVPDMWQEMGRAGRVGQRSLGVLFYSKLSLSPTELSNKDPIYAMIQIIKVCANFFHFSKKKPCYIFHFISE